MYKKYISIIIQSRARQLHTVFHIQGAGGSWSQRHDGNYFTSNVIQ